MQMLKDENTTINIQVKYHYTPVNIQVIKYHDTPVSIQMMKYHYTPVNIQMKYHYTPVNIQMMKYHYTPINIQMMKYHDTSVNIQMKYHDTPVNIQVIKYHDTPVSMQMMKYHYTPVNIQVKYCRGCDENGKYCAYGGSQTHISGIPCQCATITLRSLYRIMVMATSVVGEMNMGNIVPRAGIKLHISGIPGQCATIIPHRLPDVTTISHQPVYVALCLRGQCRLLLSSPWNCKSCNAYNYLHTGNGLTYTYTG